MKVVGDGTRYVVIGYSPITNRSKVLLVTGTFKIAVRWGISYGLPTRTFDCLENRIICETGYGNSCSLKNPPPPEERMRGRYWIYFSPRHAPMRTVQYTGSTDHLAMAKQIVNTARRDGVTGVYDSWTKLMVYDNRKSFSNQSKVAWRNEGF